MPIVGRGSSASSAMEDGTGVGRGDEEEEEVEVEDGGRDEGEEGTRADVMWVASWWGRASRTSIHAPARRRAWAF